MVSRKLDVRQHVLSPLGVQTQSSSSAALHLRCSRRSALLRSTLENELRSADSAFCDVSRVFERSHTIVRLSFNFNFVLFLSIARSILQFLFFHTHIGFSQKATKQISFYFIKRMSRKKTVSICENIPQVKPMILDRHPVEYQSNQSLTNKQTSQTTMQSVLRDPKEIIQKLLVRIVQIVKSRITKPIKYCASYPDSKHKQ